MDKQVGHTPGPWWVVSAQRGYIVTAQDGCYDIAIIRDIGSENNRANAQLIAAAPELLDALIYALPYLQAAVPSPRNGVNTDCTPDINCVDRARAAIAKAAGAA